MESVRSALRLGCPVRFRDRWRGRLVALEVDDRWLVLNLVLSSGLFRPLEVKLPFSIASDWDDDAVSLDCSSDEAFGRQIPLVAAPPRPLSAKTPLSVREARLAGALIERASRRVSDLILSRGLFSSDRRMVPVTEITLESGAIKVGAQSQALRVYRRDSGILQAVREALAAHPYLTADDRRALHVEIVDGVAFVSGSVRTPQAKANVCEAAASVRGVATIEDGVLDDRQLEIDVGRALDAAGLSRHARVYVRAALGEVTLGGFVTTETVVHDILKAAAAVPGVRSVESRLEMDAAPPAKAGPASPSPPAPTA